nr:phage tail tape measure protein [Gammaproteobacteria bacterium]
MADIANLIIRADFQNNATAGLTTLRKEVRSTATTVNSLNASLQNTKGILDRTSVSKLKASSESIKLSAAERRAAGGARALETGVRGSTASLGANAVAANTANIAVTRFGRNTRNTASNLRDIAVIGAVIGLSLGSGQRAIRAASAASVEFGEALTEVGTITGDSTASLNVLRIVANDFAGTFGSSSTEQVKAFYQAYSAGASNAAEASLLVSTANMLAVGGIATLESSVGLLASTLNAYSLEGLSAANASDLLFIAVRNGVTTISQLAQSLSRVTGTAANFGVAFGTVTAAIASLTGTGAPTAQATTQVNALILGLQRLTPEARAFATSLGISSTSPRDFVQVIRQLNGVLRGVDSQLERTSIIFRLFGTEVNALRAVASLTGGGFETFNQTLSDNERIVGATDVAYNKLHDTLSGRLMRSYGDLSAAQVKLGDELNRAIVPAVETFTDLVIVATNNIPVLGGVISALAAGALLALVRRMVALAITTTIATGGLNLLTAGTTA